MGLNLSYSPRAILPIPLLLLLAPVKRLSLCEEFALVKDPVAPTECKLELLTAVETYLFISYLSDIKVSN
jgi:hypothetical protein